MKESVTKKTKAKLKAFFAAQSMDVQDHSSEYDETFGYGCEGMSIEKIMQVIDDFDEEAIQ